MPAPNGGKRTPPERPTKRGDTKRQYVEVAQMLFSEFGYSSVGFEQIAESAGVTRAVLVRSFRNKAAFLRAIGDDWLASLFPEEPAAEESAIVAVNRLLGLSQRFLESLRSDQPVAQIILTGLAEPAVEEESTILHAVLETAVERLAPIIQEGQQSGIIRRGLDPQRTAGDWIRFLLGAALLPFPESKEGTIPTQIIETLLHGVLKTDV